MIWVIVMILGVVCLDQLTKQLAVAYLAPIDTLPLWQDVLHLTYSENPGAAFGMLRDHRWVFMVISSIAIIGILAYLVIKPPKSVLARISLAMIVGGGIGNMIDRIFLAYVVDFIDFRLIHFAIFNVADSFVSVGAVLLALYLCLDTVREMKAEKSRSAKTQETSGEQTHDGE